MLIHGFISNSTSWKRTAIYNDLLNRGYKGIVLDMHGNGQTDKTNDSLAYDHDAEEKDIIRLMTYLKIKRYNVVGYCRG